MPPQAVLFSGHVKKLTMDSSSDGDDEDEGDDNDRTSRRHRETLISVTEDLTSTSTSTTKAPTKVERKGYRRRHRPSISFEDSVPTAPRQRLKQLQFLRTVHSAQARLVIFFVVLAWRMPLLDLQTLGFVVDGFVQLPLSTD